MLPLRYSAKFAKPLRGCDGCASKVFKAEGFITTLTTAIPLKEAMPRKRAIAGAFRFTSPGVDAKLLRQRSASNWLRSSEVSSAQEELAAVANSSGLALGHGKLLIREIKHETCSKRRRKIRQTNQSRHTGRQ